MKKSWAGLREAIQKVIDDDKRQEKKMKYYMFDHGCGTRVEKASSLKEAIRLAYGCVMPVKVRTFANKKAVRDFYQHPSDEGWQEIVFEDGKYQLKNVRTNDEKKDN